MLKEKVLADLFDVGFEEFLPHISLDCVVFGFHEGQLKVLLMNLKHTSKWALPGGFVFKNEHVELAAVRVLKERTGLDDIFLEQFHLFGDPGRSKIQSIKERVESLGISLPKDHFLMQRFISVGFYALVEFSYVHPAPDSLSLECKWFDLDDVPELILDHSKILTTALVALRRHMNYQPIGYKLLPKKFTMPELQKLYETILGKKLDRRNFQRRMLGYGILRRLKEIRRGGAHKAPYLYSFELRTYHKALKDGLQGEW